MAKRKILAVLVATLMFAGQASASADFSGDFAPSNWTYSETTAHANGPSGTLSSSQMQMVSADWTNAQSAGYESGSKGNYTITIPYEVGLISFTYSYVTTDVSNSSFDMPSYTVGGTSTNIVASNIAQNGTESGTKWIDLSTSNSSTTLTFTQACTDCILGTATITITGFTATRKPIGSSLRQVTAGTTTEKNNIVSCNPGKYTFLNGGTVETAKIQSYVYTLLVNGKPVSTISSDNFRSVASHMFPTIAGNMAGTATLEGATWDLKGMSSYSAQCNVSAFQSGASTESSTTIGFDSVALAAQAEAAANVARNQEIISAWNASNEELAKKYRDQRLVAKP